MEKPVSPSGSWLANRASHLNPCSLIPPPPTISDTLISVRCGSPEADPPGIPLPNKSRRTWLSNYKEREEPEQSDPKRSPPFWAPPTRKDADYQSRHAARWRTLDHRNASGEVVAGTRSPRLPSSRGRGQPSAAGQAGPTSSQA